LLFIEFDSYLKGDEDFAEGFLWGITKRGDNLKIGYFRNIIPIFRIIKYTLIASSWLGIARD
jgi:hypothetical protein